MTCISRFTVLFSLLFAACTYPGLANQGLINKNQSDDLFKSTMAVNVYCEMPYGGPVKYGGTGVALDGRHVLTAKHVVDACEDEGTGRLFEIELVTKSGRQHRAAVLSRSGTLDAAVLQVLSLDAPFVPVPVRLSPPDKGETLCIVSAHPAYSWRVSCGEVETWRDTRFCGDSSIQVRNQTIGGSSGSGVFDQWGSLVGVHVAGSRGGGYGIECWVGGFVSLIPGQ